MVFGYFDPKKKKKKKTITKHNLISKLTIENKKETNDGQLRPGQFLWDPFRNFFAFSIIFIIF